MVRQFMATTSPSRSPDAFFETQGFKVPMIQILTAAQIIHREPPKVSFGFTEGLK